jgi:hypothetical protein
LTKPIGTGVLNAWHKATGQVSAAAIEVMTTLNADASRRALAAGDQVRDRRCVRRMNAFAGLCTG